MSRGLITEGRWTGLPDLITPHHVGEGPGSVRGSRVFVVVMGVDTHHLVGLNGGMTDIDMIELAEAIELDDRMNGPDDDRPHPDGA